MKKYVNLERQLFIEVTHDDWMESPRYWDNLWNIYTWERDYSSPDEHDYRSFDHFLENYFTEKQLDNLEKHRTSGSEHFKALEKAFNKIGYLIAPVNRYEHGSVSYNVSTASGWDYGIVGIAIVSYDTLKHEYGSKIVSKQLKEKAFKVLDSELNTYSQWANGEVYTATLMNFKGDVIDSLGGLYGDTEKEVVGFYLDYTRDDAGDFELMELEAHTSTEYKVIV